MRRADGGRVRPTPELLGDRVDGASSAVPELQLPEAFRHLEFGEVSIRFEQSSDGRLSAELTAADPELQRAVSAAVTPDRSLIVSDLLSADHS